MITVLLNVTAQPNEKINQQLSSQIKHLPRKDLTSIICAINSAAASHGIRSVQPDIPSSCRMIFEPSLPLHREAYNVS